MTTYAAMQTRIADELARDDLASQTQKAIQTAIGTWEGFRFGFNEKRFLLTTVADQEYYAWSALTDTSSNALGTGASLLEIDSIRIEYNGQWFPLTERTQSWMDEEQAPAAQFTSVPYDYAIYEDTLRLSPIPDAAYTITISGLARFATLSADADTNAWMTEGEALIRNQAKMHLYLDVIDDTEGYARSEKALQMALTSLERKSSAKRGTGRIAAWGYRG